MPTFDLFAFGKSLARFAVYLGLIAFTLASISAIINVIDFVSVTLVTNVNGVHGAFADNVPSCLGHIMDILTLDVWITQFLFGVIGLGMVWAGFVIQILILQIAMHFRKLLARSIG